MSAPTDVYRQRLCAAPEAAGLIGTEEFEEDIREKALVREYFGGQVGAFVEVGANHPWMGSQSWHLEQAGWRGILVEPIESLSEVLGRERPQAHVARYVCTRPGAPRTVTLHVPDESGFATVAPNEDDPGIRYSRREEVPARTLDEVIAEWRASAESRPPIRFVSVDVEGHELDVLLGFSMARHRPDLILIEDKLQHLRKHHYLLSQGYRLVRRTGLNDWYVPAGATGPAVSLGERMRLFRKVFLGLPFRSFRRWRHRRRGAPD